jgi:hypothetical protein
MFDVQSVHCSDQAEFHTRGSKVQGTEVQGSAQPRIAFTPAVQIAAGNRSRIPHSAFHIPQFQNPITCCLLSIYLV